MNVNQAWPDFYVIGTVKAGTTSLYHYLGNHPDVFIPEVKELHYFATEIDPDKFITQFTKRKQGGSTSTKTYRHVEYIRDENEYKNHFANVSDKLKGDFSPSYLWSEFAAEEIYKRNPNAKIIAMLRQPVERAFSHYLMDCKNDRNIPTFREAFEQDLKTSAKGWGQSHLYFELSLYTKSLQRYMNLFPDSQLLIIDFDEFATNPEIIFERVLKFLDLKPINLSEVQRHNQATLPVKPWMDIFYRNPVVRKRIKALVPNDVGRFMKTKFLSRERLPKLASGDYDMLMPLFENDILDLEKLLGKSFSHWYR